MPNHADLAAHLSFVQGVITRMAANSLQLKTLSVTFTAAVFAYMGAVQAASGLVAIGSIVAVVIFWILDARYLRLERLFRKLYDAIRERKIAADFSMDFRPFVSQVSSTLRIGFSWSVLWVHAILAASLILLAATRYFTDLLGSLYHGLEIIWAAIA
jgi:hypothetical protein